MRKDVSSLLEKLGQRDLRYRQFGDAIADLEPWPLFEALLKDPRVVGEQARATRPVEVTPQSPPAPRPAPAPREEGGLFARYAQADDQAPVNPRNAGLRSFLTSLSDSGAGDPR